MSVGESNPIRNELVNHRSANMGIAQCSNRVEALLIGAVPENIWSV